MSQPRNTVYLRKQIVNIAQRAINADIDSGSSGNISVRIPGGMIITPSGVPYEQLKPEELIAIDLNGNQFQSTDYVTSNAPSSEWRMHAEILKDRKNITSIFHSHSIYSTAVACQAKGIPSFHYMTAITGSSDIPCAKYATFGSNELAINVVNALRGRKACLLSNHGQVTIGSCLEEAFKLSLEVERLAKIYLISCQLGGPKCLSKKEMNVVMEKFKDINYS